MERLDCPRVAKTKVYSTSKVWCLFVFHEDNTHTCNSSMLSMIAGDIITRILRPQHRSTNPLVSALDCEDVVARK